MHMCRDWPVATRIIAVILDVRPMQDRVDPSWLLGLVWFWGLFAFEGGGVVGGVGRVVAG